MDMEDPLHRKSNDYETQMTVWTSARTWLRLDRSKVENGVSPGDLYSY